MEAISTHIFRDFSLFLRIEALGLIKVILHKELIRRAHNIDFSGNSLFHEIPNYGSERKVTSN